MPLISFLQNNLFHRMTRRPNILLQLSRESTEQMLRMTRLPLQMLGSRKEIKLLLLETTHCTYLISFLFYKLMNKYLSGNDCGLFYLVVVVCLFFFPRWSFSFFHIFSMKGIAVVFSCFFKIKNGISSYRKVILWSHFPILGLTAWKYPSLS